MHAMISYQKDTKHTKKPENAKLILFFISLILFFAFHYSYLSRFSLDIPEQQQNKDSNCFALGETSNREW